ncbi:reverse transcriptase domain-containing protein [Tanacetum coccineum]
MATTNNRGDQLSAVTVPETTGSESDIRKRKFQKKREEDWMNALITSPRFHLVKDVRQRGGNRGKQTRGGSTNGKIINMVYEKSDIRKRRCRRLSGPESVRRSRRSGAGDVRALLPQPVSDHLSPFNANSHGIGNTSVIPIQHNLGTNKDERALCRLLHHSCNDEVSHPRGIATLVPRRDAIFECRQLEDKQILLEQPKKNGGKTKDPVRGDSYDNQHFHQNCPIANGYGQSPKTDKSTLSKRKPEYHSGSSKATGPESQKEQGCNERRATYQKLVDSAFQTQLGRNLEACVDDMVIEIKTERDMIMDVAETFDNLKVNMKLNIKKCSSGVKGGKFLGYMVTSEWIRSNPKKTKVVASMQSSKTLKEMQSLSRKLAALNRFLSRSVERALPFFDTLKNITKENKDDFRWTEEVEQAFQELKKLIMKLPMLTTPSLKETLYLYLVDSKEAVSGVLMDDREGKQTPIRYVSRTLHEAERNYAPLEKLALCLLHLSRRLRSLTNDENLEEWTLFTDGASSLKGAGAGLVLIDPASTEYTYAIRLNFTSTKSEAEYEALLAGLPIAGKMKVRALKVKMNSKLVACQLNGEFVSNSDGVAKYLAKAKELSALFKKFSIENVPRNQNQKADDREINTIVEEEEDNWMTPIVKCLEECIWPKDENEARALRMKISQYVMKEGILFKKSYMSPMLRCVGLLQAKYIIREVHERACGMHSGVRSVVAKIMRQEYYWPSMHRDTKEVMNSLTYESKAVIPAEIDMPTYRTIHWNEAQNEEEMRLNLDFIQERRETVAIREAKYKKKVKQYYNKRVRPMSFKIRDFVYWKNKVSRVEKQGKLVQIGKDHTI